MISIVINLDTRQGCDAEVNTTGDHGAGSLHGVRSWDFLTDGVVNKLRFFSGHEVELVLFIDQHDDVPVSISNEINEITRNLNCKIVCRYNQRRNQRWNDQLYLDALKLATGDYIAHFDGDCAAFKHPQSTITQDYLDWLSSPQFAFICQPTTLTVEEHQMWWASTRFFICKRETLNFEQLQRAIDDEQFRFAYGHCPALEHVLGRMAGTKRVYYPPANWNDYMVVSWSRYHRELLHMLNGLPYEKVRDYILDCGIHGANDVISKGLP